MAGVLIIDDDAAIRGLLVEFLTSEGYRAYSAVGEMALTLASERQPDMIFLDLMMPGLDGFAIIRRLQADPRTQTMPVVVMSASYRLPTHLIGISLHGCLPKPFDLAEVLAWVERLTPPLVAPTAPSDGHALGQPALSPDEAGAAGGF